MEDLSNIEKTLVLREDDGTIGLRVCLIFTVYFRDGHKPAVREAVLGAFAHWLRAVTGHVTWAQRTKALRWQRYRDDTGAGLAQWLREWPADQGWEIALHGGEKNVDASAIFFRAMGSADWEPESLDHVTLGLPLTWFADHPGSFPEFCRTLRRHRHRAGERRHARDPHGTIRVCNRPALPRY